MDITEGSAQNQSDANTTIKNEYEETILGAEFLICPSFEAPPWLNNFLLNELDSLLNSRASIHSKSMLKLGVLSPHLKSGETKKIIGSVDDTDDLSYIQYAYYCGIRKTIVLFIEACEKEGGLFLYDYLEHFKMYLRKLIEVLEFAIEHFNDDNWLLNFDLVTFKKSMIIIMTVFKHDHEFCNTKKIFQISKHEDWRLKKTLEILIGAFNYSLKPGNYQGKCMQLHEYVDLAFKNFSKCTGCCTSEERCENLLCAEKAKVTENFRRKSLGQAESSGHLLENKALN